MRILATDGLLILTIFAPRDSRTSERLQMFVFGAEYSINVPTEASRTFSVAFLGDFILYHSMQPVDLCS